MKLVVRYSYLCIASWAKSMELPVLLQVAGLHVLDNYDHRDTCIVPSVTKFGLLSKTVNKYNSYIYIYMHDVYTYKSSH